MTKGYFDIPVILGLGSNKPWKSAGKILEPIAIIEKAVSELGVFLKEIKRASVYETAPIPKSDQPNFLNTAVHGLFYGSPEELLCEIQKIESMFGRDRSREQRWGQRTLDIDILLFGNLTHAHARTSDEVANPAK